MSYNGRPDRLGYGLGVNIRVAPYAGITHDHVNAIRTVLRGRAQAFHAPVIPVAISANPEEADAVSIEKLLAGCDLSIERCNEDTDPGHVIDAIHRCRVVVTGSYHAGVFALSSGIPAVGLAASDYYRAKFHGLAHQFGDGCTIIDLDQRGSSETLSTAIDQAWRNAEVLRPKLLARAADQVGRGRLAYRRIYDLVEARSHARPRKAK
jgi:colanic acid/amylovoran biosynthesis protein